MDVRKLVRRAERDPWNRLNSILEDADWVTSFCKTRIPHLPVIPNLRCGAWYVPNGLDKGCYFKSTDGHTTQWDFSLKRYNLDLLHTIVERGGCVIVDSTRRGKSMPDALSKTVPIWCAVLNAASHKRYGQPTLTSLCLPSQVVSASEESQIAANMEGWVQKLLESDLPIPHLEKPLRPLFVTRARFDDEIGRLEDGYQQDYYPVVLVSASVMTPSPGLEPLQSPIQHSSLELSSEIEKLRKWSHYIYVQGSGDDEEMWSFHLTPTLFWNPIHLQRILSAGEGEDLEVILREIVEENKSRGTVEGRGGDIQLGDFNIFVGSRQRMHVFSEAEKGCYKLIVQADAPIDTNSELQGNDSKETAHILRLGISLGKRGLSAFRASVPLVVDAARAAFPGAVLLCSQERGVGNDLIGGFLVAILASCFDEHRSPVDKCPPLTKDDVRRRLQWIVSIIPNFSPPNRGHLLRVNEVLLSGPYRDDVALVDEDESLAQKMASLSSK